MSNYPNKRECQVCLDKHLIKHLMRRCKSWICKDCVKEIIFGKLNKMEVKNDNKL